MSWIIRQTVAWLVGLVLFGFATTASVAADLEPIRISKDGTHFVQKGSGGRFTPWGFNYDHNAAGKLLEDYWVDQWEAVVGDFQEMKQLGANVVRIHLQFGKFMKGPDDPDNAALDRYARLVRLAERLGLYLDVTGLGSYLKKDVPEWYHEMTENERWTAQARFWQAVASRSSDSPAIFCYDLMNEPTVPGGKEAQDNWLGPAFADSNKHFVQFITRNAKGRPRPQIARHWINDMVEAIREVDKHHLVTVGLVPWSLDRPGLTSGFVPGQVTGALDFIAMHIYPEAGKLDKAMSTVQGFAAVDKPLIIEETFPLKCGPKELATFIERSQPYAEGWISFYWGTPPAKYKKQDKLKAALIRDWLLRFQSLGDDIVFSNGR